MGLSIPKMELLSLPALQMGSIPVREVRRGRLMVHSGNQEVLTLRTDCRVMFLALIL